MSFTLDPPDVSDFSFDDETPPPMDDAGPAPAPTGESFGDDLTNAIKAGGTALGSVGTALGSATTAAAPILNALGFGQSTGSNPVASQAPAASSAMSSTGIAVLVVLALLLLG